MLPRGYRWVDSVELHCYRKAQDSKFNRDYIISQWVRQHSIIIDGRYAVPLWL